MSWRNAYDGSASALSGTIRSSAASARRSSGTDGRSLSTGCASLTVRVENEWPTTAATLSDSCCGGVSRSTRLSTAPSTVDGTSTVVRSPTTGAPSSIRTTPRSCIALTSASQKNGWPATRCSTKRLSSTGTFATPRRWQTSRAVCSAARLERRTGASEATASTSEPASSGRVSTSVTSRGTVRTTSLSRLSELLSSQWPSSTISSTGSDAVQRDRIRVSSIVVLSARTSPVIAAVTSLSGMGVGSTLESSGVRRSISGAPPTCSSTTRWSPAGSGASPSSPSTSAKTGRHA